MKLKNLITAGAIGLAGLLGTSAKAHDTIRIPNEYKIVIGPGMSTWKSIEYVLFGDLEGSKRPILEQRKVSKSTVGAYETTLWDHELPEIDKHGYKSPEWNAHMKRIIKMRTDYTGFGEIEYLDWIKRNKRIDEADGIAMDKLKPGDHFWMPGRLIGNKDLAKALDKKDGCEDRKIIADGTPVDVPKPAPKVDCPKCKNTRVQIKYSPVFVFQENWNDNQDETPALEPLSTTEDPSKTKIAATAGYLSESLDGETFLQGPKVDVDFDFTTGISPKWNLAIDMDNHALFGKFPTGGSATTLDSEAAVEFDYRLNDNFSIGIGPRASVLKADINYEGNKASLMDVVAGPEASAKLRTKHFDATLDYSYNLGTGGDSAQGYNPITKNKLDLEATIHIEPAHINLGYEYENDQQKIRGAKRDNADHTIEASLDYDITKNVSATAGYETNIHAAKPNDTTANVFKGGLKFKW